jgi:hypothetical protein
MEVAHLPCLRAHDGLEAHRGALEALGVRRQTGSPLGSAAYLGAGE